MVIQYASFRAGIIARWSPHAPQHHRRTRHKTTDEIHDQTSTDQ
jgi:hypothetical protein